MSKSLTCRLRHHLMIASIVAAVVGSPVASRCAEAKNQIPPLSECEEESDIEEDGGSLGKFELSVSAIFEVVSSIAPTSSVDLGLEESIDCDAVFLIGHLERGPPLA